MKRFIILNIFFVILFIFFLLLSLYIGWFFFIPIICFLPFLFRRKNREEVIADKTQPQDYFLKEPKTDYKVRYCSDCGGIIKEPVAKYCYHCGSKLNKN